ncbi:ribonuclease Z [Antarcticibacterium arcticum]|uniref:Ribonuclease Z n=1 Tax=Antarcticibacterium arcticum TaxID=2585771 RepID=A0A5B8YFU6_9FLAO|nr:ribonuclease Z [Antarcticibacterium arcticum]QED36795.1 ribonuclease Z [Antarcticibacterium arcticum]
MEITRKDNYSILTYDSGDMADFATYLTKHHTDFEKDNVIVDVLDHGDLDVKELLMFLEISDLHRANKRSFVIASNPVSVENLPQELMIAPTLREAEDIINMEELERELGF